MTDESGRTEEVHVSGQGLLASLRKIVREGNVRRVVIKNAEGRTVLDMPLTAGVVGAALLPFWAAVGGLAALAAHYTIYIERTGGAEEGGTPDGA